MLTYLKKYIYIHTRMQMFVVTRVRACICVCQVQVSNRQSWVSQVRLVRDALHTGSVCALAKKIKSGLDCFACVLNLTDLLLRLRSKLS